LRRRVGRHVPFLSRVSIARRSVYPAGAFKSSANRGWQACGQRRPVSRDGVIGERIECRACFAELSQRPRMAESGMEYGSSYQHYEDRYKKPLLPLELVLKLVPIFAPAGVDPAELYALAGVDGSGERPAGGGAGITLADDSPGNQENGPGGRVLKIGELDVRASAGSGELTSDNEKLVAEWQIPSGMIRQYSTAPAHELRIITVMGDSMEPTLLPGQRILVDTGDRMPSPPGIFVVWDGLGLVVKRLQVVPHSEPPRVRIGSDNGKYEPYERTLSEAYIQGRVIGQWRWL